MEAPLQYGFVRADKEVSSQGKGHLLVSNFQPEQQIALKMQQLFYFVRYSSAHCRQCDDTTDLKQ